MTPRSLLAAIAGIFATLLIGAWIKDGMRLPTWENIVGAEAVAERPEGAPKPCFRYDDKTGQFSPCEPRPESAPIRECIRVDLTGNKIGNCAD